METQASHEQAPITRYDQAKIRIAEIILQSKTEEDPGHAADVLSWLLVLKPDADEILQLAAFAHDVERALPDRLRADQFPSYDEYKAAHAHKAAKVAADIALSAGYSPEDADRLAAIIRDAEFGNDNPAVNLIMDADSISYFNYNVDFYLRRHGEDKTKQKMKFMYGRASKKAQDIIQGVLAKKPEIKQLLDTAN